MISVKLRTLLQIVVSLAPDLSGYFCGPVKAGPHLI